MRTHPQFLTIVSAFLCFLTIEAIMVKQENSLYGPYQAGVGHLLYWDLTGSAQLAETTIRLTPDEPGNQGAIWSNHPMMNNDWEYHIQFHIHGKGVHLNGDGMAFWYVRDPLHSGPVFGSKDYWTGLGIFVDTFENAADPHNHVHPYLSAVVNNGTFHYHHDAQGTAGQIGGCHLQARNLEWPAKVAISYISDVLTVYVDTQGTDNWMQCFRAVGVHLPTGYSFGVSASTTGYSDNHDVVSITTLENLIPNKIWEDRGQLMPHAEFLEIPFVHKKHQQFVHEEQFQRMHQEVQQPVIHQEVHQPVIHQEVHQPVIHQEVHQPVIHQEVHPPVKHQEVHPPVKHQEVHQQVIHQEVHQPVIHHEIQQEIYQEVIHQEIIELPQEIIAEYEPELKVEAHPQVKAEPHPQVKVEPHEHVKVEPPFVKVETEPKIEPQPKKKEQPKVKEPQPQPKFEEGPKVEPIPESKVSWLRKLLYITGIGILLYVAITMFRKYSAQRRERMQKRLY